MTTWRAKMATDVCRMEVSETVPSALDEQQDDMSLEYRVLKNPVVLKIIFSCIPVRSLNKCARVCHLWAHEVKQAKKTRKGMAWHYHLCEESDSGLNQLAQEIETFVENLYFEPRFAFIFCSTNLHDETIGQAKGSQSRGGRLRPLKKDKVEVNVFLERQMPKGCKFTTITADGIIGTSSDRKVTEEMEGKQCLSFVVFSELSSGIDIIPMYYDQEEGNKIANYWSSRTDDVTVERISQDKHIKSIVFLCDEAFCPQEVGFSLYKMYKCPMIAGGFVDNVVCPPLWNRMRETPFLCCIAFCGAEVQVASVVLKDDISTADDVDQIIKKLKDNKLPEKNSIGFMFACVGRGENHYGEKNVESTVFRKYFPNTPLLGFFGNGEVGFQYPHTKPADVKDGEEHDENGAANHKFVQSQAAYLATHPPKMYHAYTTIMSIVSFP